MMRKFIIIDANGKVIGEYKYDNYRDEPIVGFAVKAYVYPITGLICTWKVVDGMWSSGKGKVYAR